MQKNLFTIEVIEKFSGETPIFLFSKEKIVKNYKDFKDNFPNSSIHYAMKANFETEILEIIRDLGCGFEVASMFELGMLKDIGVDPKKIIYGTAVKPVSHIKNFFEYGVDRFAFDSFQELEKIAITAPGSRVYARAVTNDSGSVFQFSEKFGAPIENLVPLLKRAKELGLIPYGISFHVGSQSSNPMAWADTLSNLREVMISLKNSGIELQMIDLGGGFPCKYASTEEEITLSEIAENTLKEFKEMPYQPHLIVEPGRGMIANSAVLLATVIARIERKESTWLFLDTGVYDSLFEAMAYQGSTRYRMTSLRHSYNSGEALFAVAGPTGDSCDVIIREALLPKDIDVGDKLIIHDVGAYSLVASSRFNGFPKPLMHLI